MALNENEILFPDKVVVKFAFEFVCGYIIAFLKVNEDD